MKQTRVKVLKDKAEKKELEIIKIEEPVVIVPEPVQEPEPVQKAPIEKKNPWIDHVKNVAKSLTKNITYRESLKIAGQTYKN
jgi:hypothetical protein